MKADTLVTCIIPTYDGSAWVKECVDSILSQTHPSIQTIVVDDGSTDDTRDCIRREYGSQVLLLSQANQGVASARNRGLRAASGECIAFVDQDDRWLPTKIERQLEVLRVNEDLSAVYCDAEEFRDHEPRVRFSQRHPMVTDPANLSQAIIGCQVPLVSTLLFRHEAFSFHSIWFSEEAPGVDDVGLLLEMLARGQQFEYMDWVGAERRMHDQNQSSDHLQRFERRVTLYKSLLERCQYFDAPMKDLIHCGLSDAAYRVGEWKLGHDERTEARGAFRVALTNRRGHLRSAFGLLMASMPSPVLSVLRSLKRILERTMGVSTVPR